MLKVLGLKVKQALTIKARQSFGYVFVSLGSHFLLGAVVQRGYTHLAFWCRGFFSPAVKREAGAQQAGLLQSRHCPRNGKWIGSAYATATARRGKVPIFQA